MKILICEDDFLMRNILKIMCEKLNYTTILAADGETALSKVESDTPDIVIADLYLPGLTGIELTAAVKRQHEQLPVILISSMPKELLMLEAAKTSADAFLSKPILVGQLKTVLDVIAPKTAAFC